MVIAAMKLKDEAVPNLDSILKSKDITLPAKVCLVKAMVFPVVMYGCKSWLYSLVYGYLGWKESYDQPGQHIKKQRHYFTNKGLSS